jgi:hypothetical protein
MDTTKLKVGRVVYMLSGPYIVKGKVASTAPWGVEVKINSEDVESAEAKRLYFDRDGKACNASAGALATNSIPGTWEAGPWELIGYWNEWRYQWNEVLAALYIPEIKALFNRCRSSRRKKSMP